MSTHRKIEWALFLLGAVGILLSFWQNASMIEIGLFAILTLFAGLHVAHLYDGKKANRIVIASALLVTGYTAYAALTGSMSYYLLGIGLLLTILSLRLSRDFQKKA